LRSGSAWTVEEIKLDLKVIGIARDYLVGDGRGIRSG
jgi:hypothetical protein